MPILATFIAFAFQAATETITVTGRPWAPFISPMGEPFRSRSASDDTLTRWFRQADGNGDGALTAEEMTADADRFFASLDADGNGAILPEEFVTYEWEVAPEIQVNSRWRRTRGEVAGQGPTGDAASGIKRERIYDSYVLQGAGRYALLNIPQPVAAADADFDRAVSLAEFRNAAAYRFQLLDRKGDRQLTLAELQSLLPDPRQGRRRRDRKGDDPDTRIGSPLPAGD